MKAIIYTEYGPADVLRLAEVAQPAPQENELLIKVHATTVTSGDCNIRGFTFVPRGFGLISRLMFGYRRPRKQILGVEFAGVVTAVGRAVTRFQVGDAVFGLDGFGIGAYAEYKCISETGGVAVKPANLPFTEAAAVPNGALTALTFLRKLGHLQPGQEVLIVGASGSVGSAAVQIARHFGAVVTGVCSTANVELVASLGADRVIDYTREDFTRNGHVYDIIFDTVAKTSFAACKDSLKPKGVYLASAGGLPEFGQMAWTSLTGGKKVKAGVSSERQEDLQFIKELVETGQFKPAIDRVYPLEEIVAAHRYVDQGHKRGNVVVTVA
jgi:NADPH:quinone reductase-like Zn-dependent oxidoreductase